jgi:hypothetical protein
MARVDFFWKAGVVGLLVALAGFGCSKSKPPPPAPVAAQLRAIGAAYFAATRELDHPPNNKEELVRYIKLAKPNPEDPENPETVNPAEVLRSPNDNEEFVILWGVDVMSLNTSKQNMLPVIAYEKNGKDGKRWVLQLRFARQATDEEMETLPFPPGHKFRP